MKMNTEKPVRNAFVPHKKNTGYCPVVNGTATGRFYYYAMAQTNCPTNGIIVEYCDLKKYGYKENAK